MRLLEESGTALWGVLAILLMCDFTAAQGQTRFQCNFDGESGLCAFEQDQLDSPKNPNDPSGVSWDWEARCDATPTVGTGPNTGAEGTGCFAFIETSDPQVVDDETRMWTPSLNYIGQVCVDFFYHMRGQEVGGLVVYRQNSGEYNFEAENSENVVFERFGPQGDQGEQGEWLQERVTVQLNSNSQRIGFLGIRGPDYRADIAIDNVEITTGNCDGTFEPETVNLPFMCSFESEGICDYRQSNVDTTGFDWTRRSGATGTDSTGPASARSGQFYMYIETSDPRSEGDFAILETPPINYSGAVCVGFSYHMYGENTGSLEVFTMSRGQGDPWRRIVGDQGNAWREGMVDMTLQQNDRIAFLGRRGNGIRSDIAIDLVDIFAGRCEGDLPFTCTFEADICGMLQRPTGVGEGFDDFDWTRMSGATDSTGTGPEGARTGSFYLYAEASVPRVEGHEAIIETPALQYTGTVCLRFYFHMFDSTRRSMGRLSVYLSNGDNIFDVSGDQGTQWISVAQDVSISAGHRIVFEGERGQDIQSDIAIDDIDIRQGSCTETPGPSPPPDGETGQMLPVYMCNGEGDGSGSSTCRLRQETEDQMQFFTISGRTPSGTFGDRRINEINYPVTGPRSAFQGSRYMYIEASGREDNEMARMLLEGSDRPQSGSACLEFAYNMNGFHMGELQVFIIDNGQRKIKWKMHGDQGPEWRTAAVDLRMNSVSQVGFEAFTTGEFSGDIALDSVDFNSGACYSVPSGYLWQCDFETTAGASAFCNMDQSTSDSPDYDWDLWTGATPSDETGPTFAYNGAYYLYMEASMPFTEGENANVLLPTLSRTGDVCLEFRYYMYGFHMGSLEVFLRQNGFDGQQLFTISGEKGQQWRLCRVGISNIGFSDQIGFRGVRGTEFSGDIAIDNVRVRTGICTSTESA